MKKFLWILIAAVAVAACGGKESPADTVAGLTVSPTSLSFTESDSSTKFLQVKTSGDWTVTASDWIKLNPTSGNGNGSVSVSVAANEGEARIGSVDFVSGSRKASVSVSQAGSNWQALAPAPAAFDGTKRGSTTYQLLVYSFADSDGDGVGDFKGIQNKLDYLDKLGVTALWLSPAHPTGSYHGYDVNDYTALNPLYGSESDFKALIDAAHAKGIGIYMDFVLNHSGKGHNWFQSVLADPVNSPYTDYYVLSSHAEADASSGKIDNYGGVSNSYMGGWHSFSAGETGYEGRLHFLLDSKAKTITVTETTEAVDTAPASSDWYIYCNSFKGMKKTADGVYELTIDLDTDWGFLVCSKTDWSSGSKYGASSAAGPIRLGTPFSLYTNSNNDLVGNITFGGVSSSYFAAFDASMPDLDYGPYTSCEEAPAFQATVDAATKWVNMGVDGFRLDAVLWIYNKQTAANQRFLDQWYQAVNAAYKAAGHEENIFMVGEAWEDHSTEKQYYKGLISNFEFNYGGLVSGMLGNQNASGYVSAVNSYVKDHSAIRSDAITSLFLTNHDQDRFAEWVGKSAAKEKQAAALMLTGPGKPFVYQGEELGYYGTKSNGDEYVRAPMLWDKAGKDCARKGVNNKVNTGMLKADISVETQSADENSLLNTYITWSRLRNTYSALASGEMTSAPCNKGSIAAWYMTAGSEKLLVIHNVASSSKDVSVADDLSRPVAVLGSAAVKDGILRLDANSSVVFQL